MVALGPADATGPVTVLRARAFGDDLEPLADTAIELTIISLDGTINRLTALTGLNGIAVFAINPLGIANYQAHVGPIGSNRIIR